MADGRRAFGGAAVMGSLALVAAAAYLPAHASEVEPPACQAPAVPERFVDSAAQNHFVDAAREYERCIRTYIEARRGDVERHAEAGNRAAEAFNRFAAAAAEIKPVEPAGVGR